MTGAGQGPPTTVNAPAAVIRDAVRRTLERDPDDTQDAT